MKQSDRFPEVVALDTPHQSIHKHLQVNSIQRTRRKIR
jgi:hypothetical protein